MKAAEVPATTYKRTDVGAPGRGKKLIKVKPGLLKKMGYSTTKSARARHRALDKAVKKYGSDRVWRMLHAQTIFRKRMPDHAKTAFAADRNYIKNKYGGPTPKAAIREWKGMSHRERQRRMPGGRV